MYGYGLSMTEVQVLAALLIQHLACLTYGVEQLVEQPEF